MIHTHDTAHDVNNAMSAWISHRTFVKDSMTRATLKLSGHLATCIILPMRLVDTAYLGHSDALDEDIWSSVRSSEMSEESVPSDCSSFTRCLYKSCSSRDKDSDPADTHQIFAGCSIARPNYIISPTILLLYFPNVWSTTDPRSRLIAKASGHRPWKRPCSNTPADAALFGVGKFWICGAAKGVAKA